MMAKLFPLKSILITGLALAVALWVIAPGLAQEPSQQSPPPAATPAIIPGEIIVKFQSNVSRLGAQKSLLAEGLRPLEVAPQIGAIRVEVKPGQEAQAIAELMARGDVVYASYNYQISTQGDPNDPAYSSQWALKHPQDHDIDAPEGWSLFTGGSNITIAIIDTGVDLDHPDLQAKIVPGVDYVNGDIFADDDNGHGTHVAGIAAASANNGIGIAGVSWGARIMPLKILASNGNGSINDLAEAIIYAADNGAKVINMSLGGGCGSGWPVVEDAVDYALTKGVLLIAASGNSYSTPVMCPAAINGVMAVGATNYDDTHPDYSNYGIDLDIAAPGGDFNQPIYSTWPGSYNNLYGTSMATPYVSGLAALLWSYTPALTHTQVQNIIQNTADDLGTAGWDQYYGYGRINVRSALEQVALRAAPNPLLLFIDDDTPQVSNNVQVLTSNPEPINWSATISPTVSWLSLSPPAAGTVSASSTNQLVNLNATIPSGSYGIYTATLVLTGTTASGLVGPTTFQVQLHYLSKVKTYYFPIFYINKTAAD